MISRRARRSTVLMLAAAAGVSAVVYAQLESGDRGILPIDSSGTLESPESMSMSAAPMRSRRASLAGGSRSGRASARLWAKMHNAPITQAPNLPDRDARPDRELDQRRERADRPQSLHRGSGVLFDRARAAPFLGVDGGQIRRSAPMLLIPVLVSGGTETSVELRNAWQRAWAQFRTSTSPIDYIRVSGMGADPLLVNAAQTARPGRGWWRNLLDLYGASDVLVAQVQLQRLYPGGPALARFVAMHGPDREIVGGFTLTAIRATSRS